MSSFSVAQNVARNMDSNPYVLMSLVFCMMAANHENCCSMLQASVRAGKIPTISVGDLHLGNPEKGVHIRSGNPPIATTGAPPRPQVPLSAIFLDLAAGVV